MTSPANALLIGVARYERVGSLPDAVRNDVRDMAALLCDPAVGGIDPANVTTLLDGEVTANSIRSALAAASANAGPDSTFLFYFSGHGERGMRGGREQSWLLPHDARVADLAGTALSADEIATLLSSLAQRRQVLMIDACHAGGIGATKGGAVAPKGFGEPGIAALAEGAGRALLTSSRADETSGIEVGARNSVFTNALLEALNGATVDRGDGLIGVLDVFEYVSRRVSQQGNQHPVFHAGNLDRNFAIARRRPFGGAVRPALDDLVSVFAGLYPMGPTQDELWSRAGGNVSLLSLSGTGIAQWHSALSKVQRGGGGLTMSRLASAAAKDYPGHPMLNRLTTAASPSDGGA